MQMGKQVSTSLDDQTILPQAISPSFNEPFWYFQICIFTLLIILLDLHVLPLPLHCQTGPLLHFRSCRQHWFNHCIGACRHKKGWGYRQNKANYNYIEKHFAIIHILKWERLTCMTMDCWSLNFSVINVCSWQQWVVVPESARNALYMTARIKGMCEFSWNWVHCRNVLLYFWLYTLVSFE